ncbi:MAG: hypothetical protein A2W31_07055 [Planctomycetes bacterium RBG_16_64_10]|nr:MAG: hypothetical protein A2W31_07055 [Planctomycetes bacterium RBG_16_64_10]
MTAPYAWIAGIGLALAPLVGCGWLPPVPWCHPGSASYQQRQAVRFDPYPENDLGPPVVGGRPLGFTQPPAEPVRARQQTGWNGWWPWRR